MSNYYTGVNGTCKNEQCSKHELWEEVLVDTRELADGWGSYSGDFGTCVECGSQVDVSFDIWPEDLEDPDV